MAIAEEATGTWTSSGTTEADLAAASAVDGVFQLVVDVNDMILADKLEIRAYEMAIGGGTTRQIMCWPLQHAQVDKIWVSPAMVFMNGWKFTLKATAGGIVCPWSIRKLT
jgi:hypothetical protein